MDGDLLDLLDEDDDACLARRPLDKDKEEDEVVSNAEAEAALAATRSPPFRVVEIMT